MASPRGRGSHHRRNPWGTATCRRWWWLSPSPVLSRRKPDLGSSSTFSINLPNGPDANARHISVRTCIKQHGWVLRGARHCSPCKTGRGEFTESFVSGGEQSTGQQEVPPRLLPTGQMHLATQQSHRKETAEVLRAARFPPAQPNCQGKAGYKRSVGNRPRFHPAHPACPHLRRDMQLQRRSLLFPLPASHCTAAI